MQKSRFIISGGGTGGHFYPALAIADFLSDKGCEILYIGAERGIERKKLPDKYRSVYLRAYGWNRGSFISLFKALIRLFINLLACILILLKYKPEAVIITGGYASIAAGLAAVITFRKLIIQEQNAFPGLTTRLLAFFSNFVSAGFPFVSSIMPFKLSRVSDKTFFDFNPVRQVFFEQTPCESRSVVFWGGSQGSAVINNVFEKTYPWLVSMGYMPVLVTGERFIDEFDVQTYDSARIIPFTDRPWELLSDSCFVFTRCGALSLSEIIACGTVPVMLPFSSSANGHQLANAQYIANSGAGVIIEERVISTVNWEEVLKNIENNYNEMKERVNLLRAQAKERDFFTRLLNNLKQPDCTVAEG